VVVGRGLTAPVRPALLVDEGVREAGAGVPHRVAGTAYPRPVHVEPGQRGLHEVLGQGVFAGREQPRHPDQRGALGGDEVDELCVSSSVSLGASWADLHRTSFTSLTGAGQREVAFP
jgi:hypothetical protein